MSLEKTRFWDLINVVHMIKKKKKKRLFFGEVDYVYFILRIGLFSWLFRFLFNIY